MNILGYALAVVVWIGALVFYSTRLARTNLAAGKRYILVVLRCISLGLLLYLLSYPVVSYKTFLERPLHLFAVADCSRSMSLPDQKSGLPRMEVLRRFLYGADSGLVKRAEEKGFAVHVFSKAGSIPELVAAPESLSATGEVTDIGGTLQWIKGYAGDLDVGGIVLLTDGRDTTGSDPTGSVSKLPGPLYTVGFGPDEEIIDVSVFDLSAPPSVPSEETFEARAAVRLQGGVSGIVKGEFLIDGNSIASATAEVGLATRAVVFTQNIEAKEPGIHNLTFKMDLLPDEIVSENNTRERKIQFEKNRFNVLLLAGRPSMEFKFLRRAIQNENRLFGTYLFPRKEGGTVLSHDPEEGADGVPVPEKVEIFENKDLSDWIDILNDKDLVIIQQMQEVAADRRWATALENWLGEENRTLMFVGPEVGSFVGTPMESLLPFGAGESSEPISGEFILRVPESKGSYFPYRPFMNFDFEKFPPLLSLWRVGRMKTGSEVLLEAVDRGTNPLPALTVGRRGLGYVAVVDWGGTWQWALLAKKADELNRFWDSLILFFLTGEEASPITLHAAGETFEVGETIRLWLYLSENLVGGILPEKIPLEISSQSTSPRRIYLYPSSAEPGRYEGSFSVGRPGDYSINTEIGGYAVKRQVLVETESAEMENLNRNGLLLASLAEKGGGRYFAIPDPGQVLDRIPFKPKTETIERFQFMGRLPWMIFVLLGLFTLEWLLRRRFALP